MVGYWYDDDDLKSKVKIWFNLNQISWALISIECLS